eukprot:4251167-Alexandrium_andersonii.AAC.1
MTAASAPEPTEDAPASGRSPTLTGAPMAADWPTGGRAGARTPIPGGPLSAAPAAPAASGPR